MFGIYSLFDEKSGKFNSLQLMYSDEDAKRTIKDVVLSQPSSLVAKFPKDFKLYSLGTFNTSTGAFDIKDIPELLCYVSDLLVNENNSTELTPIKS